jgi:hypothetical protein
MVLTQQLGWDTAERFSSISHGCCRYPALDSTRRSRSGLGEFAEKVWLVERRASRIKRSTHHSYTEAILKLA